MAALGALGAHARGRLPDRVVGVTGSVGKTSVKDLLAAALGARWCTAAGAGSFNNELGVPLTILGAAAAPRRWWWRWGPGLRPRRRPVRHRPPHGRCGDRGGRGPHRDLRLARRGGRGQGRARRGAAGRGTAVLNADDPRVAAMAHRTAARVLTYGTGAGVDVRAERAPSTASCGPGSAWSARGARPTWPWRCGAGTWSATPWRRRPPPWCATCRSRGGRRAPPGLGLPLAHGDGPPAVGCPRPQRRLQRQPHVDGRRPAVPGRSTPAGGWRSSGSWPSSVPPATPSTPPSARWPATWASRWWPWPLRLRRHHGGRRRRGRAGPRSLGDGDAVLLKGSRVAGLERLVDLLR